MLPVVREAEGFGGADEGGEDGPGIGVFVDEAVAGFGVGVVVDEGAVGFGDGNGAVNEQFFEVVEVECHGHVGGGDELAAVFFVISEFDDVVVFGQWELLVA